MTLFFFVKDATVAPTLAIDPSGLNLRPFRTRQTNSTAGVRSNQNSDTILVSFYRAMLCIRDNSHGPVSVCLSVRPSQVSVLLKRLNVGSHKQHHTIAQEL